MIFAKTQDATVACRDKQGVIGNDHRVDCSLDAITLIVELQRRVGGADFTAQSFDAPTAVLNFALVLVSIDDFIKRQQSASDGARLVWIEGGEPTARISPGLG